MTIGGERETVAAPHGRGLWLMQERVNALGGPEPWPAEAAGASAPMWQKGVRAAEAQVVDSTWKSVHVAGLAT